ncbi:hypothetical protein L211DRAFT_851239 [Terfezia boudieri ATCC MYA-4762]|uniref:Zn(2)-C6 fungal-type domain-containing protein n=1 Tax=Terfezia boudieri ATCC MYA-4762 TaxID=1051890 RepID=A0A3N4LFX1_9PEZI|nr:hypothetical protein L211DRAFT_851239 [Terfezia boudieri ATCC MYA-4762]
MSAQQSADSECSTSAISPTSQTKQLASSKPAAQSLPETNSIENVSSSTATLNETVPPTSASAVAKASRKRTKTGCLTCRKRRIKCGEERPICANCVKSKRTCEGYNQRVVFKDGMNSLRAVTGIPGASSIPIDRRYYPHPIQPAPPALQTLQPIAPAPPASEQRQSQAYSRERQLEHAQLHLGGHTYALNPSALHSPHAVIDGRQQQLQLSQQSNCYGFSPTNSNDYPLSLSTSTETRPSPLYEGLAAVQQPGYNGTGTVGPCLTNQTSASVDNDAFNSPITRSYSISRRQSEGTNRHYGGNDIHPAAFIHTYQPGVWGNAWPHEALSEEELYDVQGDEDEELLSYSDEEETRIVTPRVAMNNLLASIPEPGRGISFKSFLPDCQTLSTYYPSKTSSPLTDPVTARIFCHFIYVLGPSISIFERNAPNPAVSFTPGSQAPKNVWAYTIPMLALGHPPLLHSILALSSLHIAKLTKGPSHPSLLHYHIALRRLGRSIADERKRGHVATLAATLILAYYETMAAEHEKWASHLHGAKQLLQEIDFVELSRGVESLEEERALREQYPEPEMRNQRMLMMRATRRQRDVYIVNDLDDGLIMSNKDGRRDPRTGKGKSRKTKYSTKELETCQLQSDLFWWYAKMDLYQSLLSGNPLMSVPQSRDPGVDHLFLLMGRLADFQARDIKRKKAAERMNGGWIPPPELGGPPRGMMGMEKGRGRLGPQPGMGGPPMGGPPMGMGMNMGGPGVIFPRGPTLPRGGPPPQMQRGGSPTTPNGGAVMYGMIPDEPARLPRAFAGTASSEGITAQPGNSELPTDPDVLEALTVDAEREWNDIYNAFQVFQDSLGQEYKPMPIEYMPVQSTPFGPTIYYRTYSIATLQSLYYTALIILHRIHPSMPAQVMTAAGVAAPKTAQYAILIARITAGLVPTDPTAQIHPSLAASLIEASIPLFFAGVQYQEKSHRDWLINKLREINRLSGWASAARVLLGCLTAWEKMAKLGRGPVYERPPPEDEADVPLPGMAGHSDTKYYEEVTGRAFGANGSENWGREEGVLAGGEIDGRNFILTCGVKNRLEFAMGLLGEPDEIIYPIAIMRLDDE